MKCEEVSSTDCIIEIDMEYHLPIVLLKLTWKLPFPVIRACVFQVPIGTFFRGEDGAVVADLQSQGDMFVGARGGAGGHGNYYFLSNENRAPMTCEEGAKGEAKVVYAELRIIAHVGMVC